MSTSILLQSLLKHNFNSISAAVKQLKNLFSTQKHTPIRIGRFDEKDD